MVSLLDIIENKLIRTIFYTGTSWRQASVPELKARKQSSGTDILVRKAEGHTKVIIKIDL
jgi:hypothetical protein